MMQKVLFININFYEYDARIADAIQRRGYDVDVLCHQPPENYFWRVANKVNVRFSQKRNYLHQQKFLVACKENFYDVIFVIVGRYLTEEFLIGLRNKNPNAHFILYLWDDIARVENFSLCSKYYDKIYTFDTADSKTFKYELLPLFYTEDFKGETEKVDKIFFSGWLHSDRAEVLNRILPQLGSIDKDIYLFITRYQAFKHNNYGNMNLYLRFSKMGLAENANRMNSSRIVIDIQHPTQIGLTMRTIESIGAKTKLITTNKNITAYDFYDPRNILVIDRENPVVPEYFLQGSYKELDSEITNKYRLDRWVDRIFEGM